MSHPANPSPDRPPLNAARGQTGCHTTPVPPAGDTPPDKAPPLPDEKFLHRTMPSRQRSARAFLKGQTPGVQQSYAPGAETSSVEGWVEDDETVERLARWRREAPYG